MKFVLFTALAITGLVNARQYPDFYMDPLHKNIHDTLDSVPVQNNRLLHNIAVPIHKNYDYTSHTQNLEDDFIEFTEFIPMKQWIDIIREYNKDPEVQDIMQFLFTEEFHEMVYAVESTEDFKALVLYLQKIGYNVATKIQFIHTILNMNDYVPPEIESIKSQFGMQKVGDGMESLLKDLYDELPLDKIDALHNEKMENSTVFNEFITKLISSETKEMINNLYNNETYKKLDSAAKEKGLVFEDIVKLYVRIYGIIL